jgi:putative flippase GtrA
MNKNASSSRRARFAAFPIYIVVGAAGTALQYAILFILVSTKLMHPVLASCIGAIAGAILNYGLNYRVTFRSAQRHANALPKFFTVALAGLVLNWLIMTLFVKGLDFNYMIAQIVATGFVLGLTFSLNSLWSFKHEVA